MTSISDTNVVNAPGGLVELSYIAQTWSGVASYTKTSAATADLLLTTTVVCDGSPILIEFQSGAVCPPLATNSYIVFTLEMDGTVDSDWWGCVYSQSTAYGYQPVSLKRRMTPSAGVHTFNVKVYVLNNTGYIYAGPGGGAGNMSPTFLRVSKVIQASQLIVQTPNAPLVTSLPSNAIDGQEVRYLADNTNGIIWNFRYRAGSSSAYKWEFVGGTDLVNRVWNGWQTENTTSTSYVDLASIGPQITVPLAGEYRYLYGGLGRIENLTYLAYINLAINGTTSNDRESHAYGNDVSGFTNTGTFTATTSSTVAKMVYRSGGPTTAWFHQRYLSVIPIRVSA